MRKYSIFHLPVLSFFSKDLYADVALHWKGVNFLFLLLLLVLCLIPPTVKIHLAVADFVENEAPAMLDQIPEITIADGKASIEEEQPYYITAPDGDDVVIAIIDTTGQIASLESADAYVLLTEDAIITKHSNVEKRTYELSEIEETFMISGEKLSGWLQVASKYLSVIIYPVSLIGSYIYRIVQVLVYAAVGLIFASSCKITLQYPALMRLAVVAITPCIIVDMILSFAGVPVPPFLYLAAAMGYLYFGVKSTSDYILETDEIEILRSDSDMDQ